MNGKELKALLIEKLEEHEVSVPEFIESDYDEVIDEDLKRTFGVFDQVHNERTMGSGDFDGQQAVFKFKDHNVFLAFEGSYSSYGGTDFDDCEIDIVKPVEVTTTEYRKVKK